MTALCCCYISNCIILDHIICYIIFFYLIFSCIILFSVKSCSPPFPVVTFFPPGGHFTPRGSSHEVRLPIWIWWGKLYPSQGFPTPGFVKCLLSKIWIWSETQHSNHIFLMPNERFCGFGSFPNFVSCDFDLVQELLQPTLAAAIMPKKTKLQTLDISKDL